MTSTTCRTCGQPITRTWAPTDPSLREYHAGCRPGAGRIPYRLPERPVETDPFDISTNGETDPEPITVNPLNVSTRALNMAAAMQAIHDRGQHGAGMPRGICAACDFGPESN